jgi:hypothetical protein
VRFITRLWSTEKIKRIISHLPRNSPDSAHRPIRAASRLSRSATRAFFIAIVFRLTSWKHKSGSLKSKGISNGTSETRLPSVPLGEIQQALLKLHHTVHALLHAAQQGVKEVMPGVGARRWRLTLRHGRRVGRQIQNDFEQVHL